MIGDCFQDVIITTVNVSQKSNPTYRRPPNADTSTVAYSDHIEEAVEVVPSAVDLTTGGSGSSWWIYTFILITVLSTAVCACLGVRCIQGGYYRTAAPYANDRPEDQQDDRAKHVDGTTLDTPKVYSKANRMFSPPGSSSNGGRPMSAREKRAALNARNAPRLHGNGNDSMDDFEVLSNGSETSTDEVYDAGAQATNPLFLSPRGGGDKKGGHAPRLSMLDFGKTIDEDKGGDSEVASEFWRRRNRTGDDGP